MGELVQSDGDAARLYRLGFLASALERRGHHVTRWIPTFVHTQKRQRFERNTVWNVSPLHQIYHIYAKGYSRNLGPGRVRFHREVARRWERLQTGLAAPDVILTSMPTPDICAAARRIGARRSVPYVIDVRDLWPDVMSDVVPARARAAVGLLGTVVRLGNRRSFRAAAAITGVSEEYVNWGVTLAGRPRSSWDRMFPHGYTPPAASKEEVALAKASWKTQLSDASCVCLFLGTFSRQFDLSAVIRAARQLSRDSPGTFAWVLCGDGPTRTDLEREAAGLPNVLFPGWLGGADMVALLGMASIGLAPYAANAKMSLPNKPFEYAWAGLPVVSSLRGELATLLEREEFGITYRADDASALARILLRYAKDESLRERHAIAARRLWSHEYSAAVVYDNMAGFLEEIAVRCAPGAPTRTVGLSEND